AVGEDPDELAVLSHEQAVNALRLHPGDRVVDGHARLDGLRGRGAQLIQVHAEQPAVEGRGWLGQVGIPQVGAAVGAAVVAGEVAEAADRAAHGRPPRLYSTTQVSPASRSFFRSPAPRAAVAWESWSLSIWSWVGRAMRRITPTGTGNSGQ